MSTVYGFPPTIEGAIYEGMPFDMLARIQDDTGDNATTSSYDSANYYIYDSPDKTVLLNSGSLTIGDILFDTLQTGPKWNRDNIGYNFLWTVAWSLLGLSDEATYWIEVQLKKTGTLTTVVTARIYQYPLKSVTP